MLKKLAGLVKKDKDLPDRAYTINVLEHFRTGKIYDLLPYEFYEERDNEDKYVPMCDRAPSVRFGLLSIIVNDSTSLLFGDGHFPAIDTGSKKTDKEGVNVSNAAVHKVLKDSALAHHMLDAAVRGSVGSIVVMMKVLKNRIFWEVMTTEHLTPIYKNDEPDTLSTLIEKYKAKGKVFKDLGYAINDKDLGRDFWFQRDITETEEVWYLPWPVDFTDKDKEVAAYRPMTKDEKNSVSHKLGFNPCLWIKNLPGGDGVDGAPTFPDMAIANAIEIDYLMSQNGRGLKYTADPTLLIKEPGFSEIGATLVNGPDGQPKAVIVNGAADALKLSADGDAKMLEISGAGFSVVLEQVNRLREMSLELCGGNRASPEKLSAAQSGKAMELMNQSLIWLASKLRQSYGEQALVNIVAMVAAVNKNTELRTKTGEKIAIGDIEASAISLKWPPWYPPTAADHQSTATALKTYRDAGVLQRKTAVRFIQHDFDIEDVDDEVQEIESEEKEAAEAAAKLKAPASAPATPGARAAA